jgi:hypothetical protein
LFGKRVTLLETMEKFESCVVMWDIGCHDLILEMFHIFFSVVREAHPRNVINSMQSIMTLMLDESDDIPEQLVAVIRASLGGGEKGVSSAGHRLSMYVMEHCANRLEPYSTIPPDDISTCDGQEDSTSDHEEEIASSSCDEIQDDLGVDTPKGDGALTQGESSLEQGLTLQDMHMDNLLEESHELERHSGSEMIMEGRDPETIEGVHVSQEPPLLESSETVEHAHVDSRARDSSDEDTSMWDPGLDDTSDEDTSIQGQDPVDTHGLSDT